MMVQLGCHFTLIRQQPPPELRMTPLNLLQLPGRSLESRRCLRRDPGYNALIYEGAYLPAAKSKLGKYLLAMLAEYRRRPANLSRLTIKTPE
jgi:hypothetical protein